MRFKSINAVLGEVTLIMYHYRKKFLLFGLLISLLVICVVALNACSNFDSVPKNILEKQYVPWGFGRTEIEKLSRKSVSIKQVKIAVLDSGVNFNHPDFEGKIKNGFNAINPNEKPWDDNGHGTLVTGILAAQDNSFGIIGIIPNANIFPVKVLDQFGEGEVSDVVKGIEWCIENKMNIINMSFSLNYDNPLLRKAVYQALDSGVIVVASARNGRDNNVGYPASYSGVFSIIAVDKKLNVYKESSQGKVDFSAPGVGILSTNMNDYYEIMDGNSVATPFVTGIIGRLISQTNDVLTNEEIYNFLQSNSLRLGKIDSNKKNRVYGNGFIKIR